MSGSFIALLSVVDMARHGLVGDFYELHEKRRSWSSEHLHPVDDYFTSALREARVMYVNGECPLLLCCVVPNGTR